MNKLTCCTFCVHCFLLWLNVSKNAKFESADATLKVKVHADSCEAALDTPLVYEQGWGKKLTYCLAFARDHVADVTRRYTRKFEEELLSRRTQFPEEQLQRTMHFISDYALDRSLGELSQSQATARRAALESRFANEIQELQGKATPKVQEEVGRTSGDAEWRAQRGELGATVAAREKALQLSEKGLDLTPAEPSLCTPASKPSNPSEASGSGSSEAVDKRDVLKERFAQLVAGGLSPNEAAIKLLDEVKQKGQ